MTKLIESLREKAASEVLSLKAFFFFFSFDFALNPWDP